MTPTAVRTLTQDHVVWITLDGEAQLNSLASETIEALDTALETAGSQKTTRVVVLTGAGRAFCTGADLGRLPPDREAAMAGANAVIRRMVNLEVPVVAAVNGVAVGYGASLVAAAVVAIACESASFLLLFTGLGLMPDGGLTHTLPAAVGRSRAGEFIFAKRPLTATEAASCGLVARVVPDHDLARTVESLGDEIAQSTRLSLTLTKQALNGAWVTQLDAALGRERPGQVELLSTPEFDSRSARFR